MTKILAVRSAFPAHRYPQANAGVDTRHTVLPLPEYGDLGGIGPANDRYIGEAADLGEHALRGALDIAGLTGRDLDLLIVTSVTGVAVPSLDARLISRLGLRPDIKRLPIFGLGCSAGAAALGRLRRVHLDLAPRRQCGDHCDDGCDQADQGRILRLCELPPGESDTQGQRG